MGHPTARATAAPSGEAPDRALRPDARSGYGRQGTDQPVFEGTHRDAKAYMQQRLAEGESFVVPGSIIIAGVVLMLVGALPICRVKRAI